MGDMIPRRTSEWLFGAGAVVFVALAIWWLRPHPAPIPPKEQTTLDSLRATAPDYRARVDTLIRVDSAALRQSRVNALRATEALRRADSIHAIAIAAEARSRAATDSLAALTAARLTITALLGETASLRTANRQLDSALVAQTAAHAAAEARANESERRLAATEELNRRIAADLRQRDEPCYLVPHLVRCPSRTVVYVGGVITVPTIRVVANVVTGKPPLRGVMQ